MNEEKTYDSDLDYETVVYDPATVSILTEVDGTTTVIDTGISEESLDARIREGVNLYAKEHGLLDVLQPLKEDCVHMLNKNLMEVLELRARWHMATDLQNAETWQQSFGLALDWTAAEIEDKYGVDLR